MPRGAIYTYRRPGASAEADRRVARKALGTIGCDHKPSRDHYEDVAAPSDRRPARTMLLELASDYGCVVVPRLRDLGRPTEAVEVLALLEAAGVQVIAARDGVDSATTEGRAAFDALHSMLAHEARQARERGQRAPWRGGVPPFGWTRGEDADPFDLMLEPTEAALLREAIERVLGGATPREVVHAWNARGVRTRSGTLWRDASLRRALRRPQLLGHVPDGDDVARTEDGHAIMAAEPLIDPERYERLQQALGQRATRPQDRSRSTLLGGLAVCALCGSKLTGRHSASSSASYTCSLRAGQGPEACEGVAVAMHSLETYVDAWAKGYATPALVRELHAARDAAEVELRRQAAELRKALTALGKRRDQGEATFRSEWNARATELEALIAAQRELRTGPLPAALDPDGVRWSELDHDQRRELYLTLIERIEVDKGQRGKPFDPDRVNVFPVA